MATNANEINKAGQAIWNEVKSMFGRGSEAINKIPTNGTFADFAQNLAGWRGSIKAEDENIWRWAEKYTKKDGTEATRYWDGRSLLGGLALGAVGVRFASGGGLYRDSNGNTDIAGVPFI